MKIRLTTAPDGTLRVLNDRGEPLEGVTHVALSASAGKPVLTTVTFVTEAVDVAAELRPEGMSFLRIRVPEGRG